MIKLIKNELYKVFHKKLIYIVLIIAIGGSLFTSIVDKALTSASDEIDINIYRQSIKILEDEGSTGDESYAELKTSLAVTELRNQKNIKSGSPEDYYIIKTIGPLYRSYYTYLYVESVKDENRSNEIKEELDSLLPTLDNFDWKEYINKNINEVNESMKIDCEDENNDQCLIDKATIKTLQYRLDNNIPLSFNSANSTLDTYTYSYDKYIKNLDKKDELLNHEELINKKSFEKDVKRIEYLMEHKILTNDYDDYDTGSSFVSKFASPSFMALIVLLTLSASILAEEFNKGTIKQLLVKPFSRTKILISKYITVIIASIIFLFALNISTTIITGLFEGDLNTIFNNTVLFNYNTHSCFEMNNILYALYTFLYALPEIILLALFVFALSVLLTNTAFSLGMGFGAYVSSELFIAFMNKFKFLSYMPTVNYNLTPYMFGGINIVAGLTLTKAIIVDVVSFVVLTILSIIVFKKKDIKNQ